MELDDDFRDFYVNYMDPRHRGTSPAPSDAIVGLDSSFLYGTEGLISQITTVQDTRSRVSVINIIDDVDEVKQQEDQNESSTRSVDMAPKNQKHHQKRMKRKMIIESDSDSISDEDSAYVECKESETNSVSDGGDETFPSKRLSSSKEEIPAAKKVFAKRVGGSKMPKKVSRASTEKVSAPTTSDEKGVRKGPGVKRKRASISNPSTPVQPKTPTTPLADSSGSLSSKQDESTVESRSSSPTQYEPPKKKQKKISSKASKSTGDRNFLASLTKSVSKIEELPKKKTGKSPANAPDSSPSTASKPATEADKFATPAAPVPRQPAPSLLKSPQIEVKPAVAQITIAPNPKPPALVSMEAKPVDLRASQRLYTMAEAVQILNMDWQSVNALLTKTSVLSRAFKYEEAMFAANQAINICERHESDPNFAPLFARACHASGTILSSLQRKEEARIAFQKALRMDIQSVESWVGLGYIELGLGNLQTGSFCFQKALSWDPKSESARKGLAQYHLNSGDADQALVLTSELIQARPWDEVSWKLRGHAFSVKGELAKAAEAYGMVVYIQPSDPKVWSSFKAMTAKMDDGKPSRDGQRAHANLFWWCADKGIRLANDGSYAKATLYFERASHCYENAIAFQKELDLELSECYNYYAICLHSMGDTTDQVLNWFDLAVKLNTANYVGWTNRGIAVRYVDLEA